MQEQKQVFSYPGYDSLTLISIAYGSFLKLGWTPKYAGENILIAYTPHSWKKYENEITIETADNYVTVTSKMVHGEAFDMMGRNKKNISGFIAAFESLKSSNREISPQWNEAIDQLKQQTIVAATKEVKQAAEIDKAMNLSGSNLYATYTIIAINAIVFVLMVINGAGIIDPNAIVHIKWGSNFTTLTLSGDWWRLITNVFIHFGIIHIIMNTYALYMVGVYLEPMLGKTRYVTAYLCTGVLASIASLWWHKEGVNSAGASGAIFGLYGVFLALLFTNLIPKKMRTALLQSIGVFVVYNLIYGMKSGVDNSAHIGGLLSGLVIGFVYYLGLKKEEARNKKQIVSIAFALITIAAAYYYLEANKIDKTARVPVLNEINTLSDEDGNKFLKKYNEFINMQNRAMQPFHDSLQNDAELSKKLNEISLPEWNNAEALVNEIQNYRVSEKIKNKIEAMREYVRLRKEQIEMVEKIANEGMEKYQEQYNELGKKLDKAVDDLDRL
jgi:rhomboid protease GluP